MLDCFIDFLICSIILTTLKINLIFLKPDEILIANNLTFCEDLYLVFTFQETTASESIQLNPAIPSSPEIKMLTFSHNQSDCVNTDG
jgi:hypothetical protein